MKTGSPELKDFITFILKKDPNKRPEAAAIKQHDFIRKYQDLDTS
jgi:serine/threonine protein kinase